MAKKIALSIPEGPYNSKGIIMQVAATSPERPISITDMRKRVRILDALDKATNGELVLETADFDHLKEIIQVYPFALASKEMLQVIDDVLEAKDA